MRRIARLMYWWYEYDDSVEHYDPEKQEMAERNILSLFEEMKEWMAENTKTMERNKKIRDKGMDKMNIKELEIA